MPEEAGVRPLRDAEREVVGAGMDAQVGGRAEGVSVRADAVADAAHRQPAAGFGSAGSAGSAI